MAFGKDRPEGGDDPQRQDGFLPDMVRKALERGVNVVLQGEDERKKLVAALFPKEIVNSVVQSALNAVDGTKREAVEIVGRQMQEFLQQLNLADEIRKVLTSVSFEIRTEVRFVPNEDGTLRTEVKGGATPKVVKRPAKKAKKPRKTKPKSTAPAAQAQASVASSIPGAVADVVQDAMAGTRQRVRHVVDRIAERTADLAEFAVGQEEEEED